MADKKRFVSLVDTLATGLLREAIGYRIERQIPYLDNTVGYMVEVPLLWIRHSRFPILFVAYDRRNPDLLATVTKQLEIARATEFFALIIVIPPKDGATGLEADEVRHTVSDSVYRHDFVVLDRHHLASIIAHNGSKRLIEIILEQGIELMVLSPYVVSGPVPENMFFGRESEVKEISQSISRSDFAVVGGRRIGKSSILMRLKRLFGDDPRYRSVYIDCEARFDDADFFAGLREFADLDVGGAPVSFQRLAGEIRKQNPSRLLVFLVDEVDELLAFDAERQPAGQLFKAFRAASHEGICRFVFSGGRTLFRQLRHPRSPFFNFCETVTLGHLGKKSVAEIVRKPMHQLGIDLPDEEQLVLRLIELTSGHPNIAQWMCDRLLKSSTERRITLQTLEGLAATQDFHEHYLTTAWSDASEIEKLITLVVEGPTFAESEVHHKLMDLGLSCDEHVIRESLDILRLYSVLEREGPRYRFACSEFPRIARTSGAATQTDFLANEVRRQCS